MKLWQKEEEDFLSTTQEDCANYPWRLIKIFKRLIGGKFVLFTGILFTVLFIYDFGNQCKENPWMARIASRVPKFLL